MKLFTVVIKSTETVETKVVCVEIPINFVFSMRNICSMYFSVEIAHNVLCVSLGGILLLEQNVIP